MKISYCHFDKKTKWEVDFAEFEKYVNKQTVVCGASLSVMVLTLALMHQNPHAIHAFSTNVTTLPKGYTLVEYLKETCMRYVVTERAKTEAANHMMTTILKIR